MRRVATSGALILVFLVCTASTVFALDIFFRGGKWPEDWPKELEPFRAQSSTRLSGIVQYLSYEIPFENRADFEAVWPHLLKIKTQGAPVRLVKHSTPGLRGDIRAGVYVRCPPSVRGELNMKSVVEAVPNGAKWEQYWGRMIVLDLVVDGEIVDLNRIEMPADTPIVDARFKEQKEKPNAKIN